MTTLYLIRHTQAEGNLYRAMQGQWDGDITPIGLKQIEKLSEGMKDVKIDKVYSSDLYRAYITAKLGIADPRGLTVEQDARLREILVGEWETRFFGNAFYENPESARLFMFDSEKWTGKGAETFPQVRERMYAAIEDLAKKNDGKTIALVSHGVSLRCFLSKVYGVNLSDIETVPICKNTAVTKVEYENGKFNVLFKNDFSHLGKYNPPSWSSAEDVRDVILNPYTEGDYYTKCYAEGWAFAHEGSLEGFDPNLYLAFARTHYEDYEESILRLLIKETDIGLVDLDTEKGKENNIGWLSFLYLNPDYRGKGYGIQALGRAIMTYKIMGRDAIRLNVNKKNKVAIAFYESYGFHTLCQEGDLLLMEKSLHKLV